MPIPHTLQKLSQSLLLWGAHQTDASILPFEGATSGVADLITKLGEFFASWKQLGATYAFDIEQTRANYVRRGINSPIEGFASVPGPITTTLNLTRSVLYLQDAMAAFSFMPGNIAFQTRPLIMVEFNALPEDAQGNNILSNQVLQVGRDLNFDLNQTTPIIYTGCWITSSSIKYDLKGNDQAVVQGLTMSVTRIVNPISLVPPLFGVSAATVLAQGTVFLQSSPVSRGAQQVGKLIGL